MRVLIIDDEPFVAAAVAEPFTDANADVHCATEPEEAEALFHHYVYDVIITDLSFSAAGSEGLELLKSICGLRTRPLTVVLSGHTDHQHERAARARGAHLFLRKPIVATDIYTTICGRILEPA